MSKAYDPSARANAMQVKYKVNTTGDRWFIPYNDSGTTAAQVAQCKNKLAVQLTVQTQELNSNARTLRRQEKEKETRHA
ncbi:MAG: hypothetical protein CM15mV54_290 [Caudoviricetes sp.]|nr:MAG: hypothetical protein CM15mV54_290 [Caudoviricetes sp.]